MIINPRTAIEKGWIEGNITEEHIQPNAIDFTLDKVHTLVDDTSFIMLKDWKTNREQVEYKPYLMKLSVGARTGWKFEPFTSYDCESSFYLKLPAEVAALLIIRSSFNRNGLFLTSGLFDSNFHGSIGNFLHNNSSSPAYVEQGCRLGQVMFIEAGTAKLYQGEYSHSQGKDWRK